jgi:hypothetical protein
MIAAQDYDKINPTFRKDPTGVPVEDNATGGDYRLQLVDNL